MPKRFVPVVLATELGALVRTALSPLARLRPLPSPGDSGDRPPVFLVHGFMGHAGMLRPLTRRLLNEGWTEVIPVSYPSLSSSLEQIVERIADEADRAAGDRQIDLVGHSLGAVACRAWIKAFGGAPRVRRFVSLGGPHGGTSLHRVVPRHLREVFDPRGPWVARLAVGPEPVPTTVIRARWDHQVVPSASASLAGVSEIVLEAQGHNGLLWASKAHDAVVGALR
jgi:pimeloyl-ACP methyl ester carboxylesterase